MPAAASTSRRPSPRCWVWRSEAPPSPAGWRRNAAHDVGRVEAHEGGRRMTWRAPLRSSAAVTFSVKGSAFSRGKLGCKILSRLPLGPSMPLLRALGGSLVLMVAAACSEESPHPSSEGGSTGKGGSNGNGSGGTTSQSGGTGSSGTSNGSGERRHGLLHGWLGQFGGKASGGASSSGGTSGASGSGGSEPGGPCRRAPADRTSGRAGRCRRR